MERTQQTVPEDIVKRTKLPGHSTTKITRELTAKQYLVAHQYVCSITSKLSETSQRQRCHRRPCQVFDRPRSHRRHRQPSSGPVRQRRRRQRQRRRLRRLQHSTVVVGWTSQTQAALRSEAVGCSRSKAKTTHCGQPCSTRLAPAVTVSRVVK